MAPACLAPSLRLGWKVGAQQLLAAEHVQRQVAVAVVVAVKEAPLLLAVQRVVGGIKVEHEFLGRSLEAGDELIHQNLVQAPGGGRVSPFLQTAQGGGAGDFAINTDCRLHGHIQPQCAVVVQVLPPQCQTVDALAQQVGHAVRDQERAARVGDAMGRYSMTPASLVMLPPSNWPSMTRRPSRPNSILSVSISSVHFGIGSPRL